MTVDLRALAHDIAEAAARCVGAKPRQTQGHTRRHGPHFGDMRAGITRQTVHLAARAGAWRAECYERGTPGDALDAATVLALRERVQRQRDERARLLAADDAALDVIDATARIYDAATVAEAARGLAPDEVGGDRAAASVLRVLRVFDDGADASPWTGAAIDRAANCLVLDGRPIALRDACDAIRRRAAEAPQGGGQVVLPADVAADGTVTVRAPGREP